MVKGDILLIPFPFTNLSGSKLRPAVVLAESSLDITVNFITAQLHSQEPTDVMLKPNSTNGLKKASLIRTSKIATLDKSLARGFLGNISPAEILDLNQKLKIVLNLP